MRYQILTGSSPEDLMLLVNSNIDLGWSPIGGVCVMYDPDNDILDHTWTQALVWKGDGNPQAAITYLNQAVEGCSVCGDIGCRESLHWDGGPPS